MEFEIFSTYLQDLSPNDPMYPAAIVHILGENAGLCYSAVNTSFYVIGRGPLPPEVRKIGYFFVASQPDYPILRQNLLPFWPEMPERFPQLHLADRARFTQSQELSDAINYVAVPPRPDPTIFNEARKRLRKLVPRQHLLATAQVCQWLRENMQPANNCYTLSTLLTGWLAQRGIRAQYRAGKATLRRAGQSSVMINHAWVELEGQVIDLTVDRQREWGDLGRAVAKIGVNDRRILYQPVDDESAGWEQTWRNSSKPAGRPRYTAESLRRQDKLIREVVGPLYEGERITWMELIREYGLIEGTYRLL
ncbi:MAG TPA: hypothetical protein ENN19_12530, partial [Chloroflexi bacterium]|nr:hypothetical protein [Chloroflexota bacterium]